jgi:hydrogenase-4 component E
MSHLDNAFLLVGFLEIAMVIFMQWEVYITNIIKTFSISSYLIALLFLIVGFINKENYILILAALTALTRGLIIPLYLRKILRKDKWRARETSPLVGISSSILISLLITVLGYLLYSLTLSNYINSNLGPIPITLMMQGMFLIISRSSTFTQLIGYLVMENAMYMFGYIFPELPFIVEAGIVLDLLGVVMISGAIIRLREDVIKNGPEEYTELKG